MGSIASNLQRVKDRVCRACLAHGRDPDSVVLLAVGKTFGPSELRQVHAQGQCVLGENYVQEALEKIESLADLRPQLQWHLIGPLQSNKTRAVAAAFDWVQSVDRLKIAERLSEQRPPALAPLQVCLQVNIDAEASKSGLLPAEVAGVARAVAALPRLRLRGLMSIPEATTDPAAQRSSHRALRELQQTLIDGGLPLDTLSMGMSADLEAAIAEGATLVRVGSAIFGPR